MNPYHPCLPHCKKSNTNKDRKEELKETTPKKKSKTTKEIREEDSKEDSKPLPSLSPILRKVVYKAAGALGLLEQGDTFFGRNTIKQLEGIGVVTVQGFVKSVLVINHKLSLKGDMEFGEVVLQAILYASMELMNGEEM